MDRRNASLTRMFAGGELQEAVKQLSNLFAAARTTFATANQ